MNFLKSMLNLLSNKNIPNESKPTTIKNLWVIHHKETTHYLLIKNLTNGKMAIIDGLRPEDPEGGCMATGTIEAIYGRTFDDKGETRYWYHSPYDLPTLDENWILVKAVSDEFYIKKHDDGKIYRGIGIEKNYYVCLQDGKHLRIWKNEGTEESSHQRKYDEPEKFIDNLHFQKNKNLIIESLRSAKNNG